MNGRAVYWLPLGVAALVQLLVALTTPCVPMNDTIWYLSQTFQYPIPRPADFYAPVQPAAAWDVLYPPGLPWVYDVMMLAFGHYWIVALLLAQHVLRLVTVWLLMRLGSAAGQFRIGWWAALFYAMNMRTALYCQALLSEPFFSACLMFGVVCAQEDVAGRAGRAMRAGIWLAVSSVFRFQILTAPVLGIIMGAMRARQDGVKRGVRHALCFAVPGVAVLTLIVVWNGLIFKEWTLTTCTGRHFFQRAFMFSNLEAPGDAAYERLLALGTPPGGLATDNPLHGRYYYEIYPLLRQQGLSCREADALMGAAAHAAMRRMPMTLVRDVLLGIFNTEFGGLMSRDIWVPAFAWRAPQRPPLDRNPWLIPGVMAGAPAEVFARRPLFTEYFVPDAPPLPYALRMFVLDVLERLPEWNGLWIWFMVAGTLLVFSRDWRPVVLCAAVPFWTLLLLANFVEGPIPRYYTAVQPLGVWLGCCGIAWLGGRMARDDVYGPGCTKDSTSCL